MTADRYRVGGVRTRVAADVLEGRHQLAVDLFDAPRHTARAIGAVGAISRDERVPVARYVRERRRLVEHVDVEEVVWIFGAELAAQIHHPPQIRIGRML